TDVLKKKVEDFSTRRATEKLLEDVQDRVAQKLCDLIRVEFANLPDHEAEAASLAVGEAFDDLPLTATVLEADLDATRLSMIASERLQPRLHDLTETAQQLANALVRESANYIVSIAGALPNFQVVSTREILKRDSRLAEQLARVVEELSGMRADQSD